MGDAMPDPGRGRELPAGTVTFDVELDVAADGGAFCRLAVDLDAYTAVEPALSRAAWIDPPPIGVGSRAAVEGHIPFSVAAVRRFIGEPSGTATLTEFAPPTNVAYTLETARAAGFLRAVFRESGSGNTVVAVSGWITPQSRGARLALAPWTGVLRALANRAVGRGVRRADAAVRRG